jgi:hypothetical protein
MGGSNPRGRLTQAWGVDPERASVPLFEIAANDVAGSLNRSMGAVYAQRGVEGGGGDRRDNQ